MLVFHDGGRQVNHLAPGRRWTGAREELDAKAEAGMQVDRVIKARCADPDGVRRALEQAGATPEPVCEQYDVVYPLPGPGDGRRLKLRAEAGRTGAFVYDQTRIPSWFEWFELPAQPPGPVQAMLDAALGTGTVVRKRREQWRLASSVVIHIDEVESVGTVFEAEVFGEAEDRSDGTILESLLSTVAPLIGETLEASNEHLVIDSHSSSLD